MPQKAFIIVVNYNGWQDTIDCVESILCSSYEDFSIVIVDNASPNDSVWRIRSHFQKQIDVFAEDHFSVNHSDFPKLVLVEGRENSGFAAANNKVLRKIIQKDVFVWLVNPDIIVKGDCLVELTDFYLTKTPGSVVGSVIRSYAEKNKVLVYGGGRVNFSIARSRPVYDAGAAESLDYISGSSLFTHAENFRKYGLFPEQYFLYWEETDWCYQAKRQGAQLLTCPSAICYDKISTVIGKGFLAHYYYCRNGLYFISKYRRGMVPLVLLSMLFRIGKRLVTGQWKIASGIFQGTLDFLKKRKHALQ